MTKGELLKRLEGFDANADVVFSSDVEDYIDSEEGVSVNAVVGIYFGGEQEEKIVLLNI